MQHNAMGQRPAPIRGIAFALLDWAAYAPGLDTREAWRAWARDPSLPHGDATPALSELPAMMRRRIDRLGRVAIQAAAWCRDADAADVPVVFASRHGDVARSQQLLDTLAAGEGLSPAAFGLSVHNAIAALYSIAYGERGHYTALAAGIDTAEAALMEAAGLLDDGAAQVQVVVYDATIPDVHAGFLDEPDPLYAWAWRIGRAQSERPCFSLEAVATEATVAGALPRGLDVLRFVLGDDAQLERRGAVSGWRWRRHG